MKDTLLDKRHNWGLTSKQYRKRLRGGGLKNHPVNLKKLKPFKLKKDLSRKKNYERYMRSRDWALIKLQIFSRDHYKCRKCHATIAQRMLNVHHLTYERVFHEKFDDLITLCSVCHREEHNL